MRANEKTVIVGEKVVLVPYRQKYHEWMLSNELRELTASELLTLDEEYEMQRKWQEDEDKLTFIVLSRGDVEISDPVTLEVLITLPMIGDVNLFLHGDPSEDDFEVESEIMIAEPAYRHRGFASAALQLMFSYATSSNSPPLPIPRDKLIARIGDKNTASIRLFENLGFVVTKRVAVFEEVELRFKGNEKTAWKTGEVKELIQ